MISETKKRAFSAPGKALFVGGYLVLDSEYDAYVTALSSRMHAIVNSNTPVSDHMQISFKSPQFTSSEWKYIIKDESDSLILKEEAGLKNPFLESVVMMVMSYISPKQYRKIVINFYSDPGYHSQDETESIMSYNKSKAFLYHKKSITEVPKTGMGSSAGLVTVAVTALLSCLIEGFKLNSERSVIHNLSQIAHCHAQDKIGSGFDVAAATYGSIIYTRFEPELVDEVLHHKSITSASCSNWSQFGEKLRQVVNSGWHFRHDPCNLPKNVKLLMGDVKGGSETPKLVSKVLKWKKENPVESKELFTSLNSSNMELMQQFKKLETLFLEDTKAYRKFLESIKNGSLYPLKSQSNPFQDVTTIIGAIRKNLKVLMVLTGAEIEPPEQTRLLDACNEFPGCLGGVVPGAGGYDALSVLVIDECIPDFIKETKKDLRFEKVHWLGLREEQNGLVEENPNDYQGLE